MTNKQRNDIECVKYFIPSNVKWETITQQDEKMFLEYSEQGKHKDKVYEHFYIHKSDGFNALVWGKIWRSRFMEIFEQGVLMGDMPYSVILEDKPESVVEFMAKTMFKGKNYDLIKQCKQSL